MNSKSNHTSSPLSKYLVHRTLAPDFAVVQSNQRVGTNPNFGSSKEHSHDTTIIHNDTYTNDFEFRTRDSIHALIQSRMKLLKELNIDHPPMYDHNTGTSTSTNSNVSSSPSKKAKKRPRKNNNDHYYQRMIMDYPSNIKLLQSTTTKTTAAPTTTKNNHQKQKIYFDVDELLHNLQRDPHVVQIIQNTFSIAAMCVVNALKDQIEHRNRYGDDDEEEEEEEEGIVKEMDVDVIGNRNNTIPALLRIMEKMNQLKYDSFQLAEQHDTIVKKTQTNTRKRKSASNNATTSSATPTKNDTSSSDAAAINATTTQTSTPSSSMTPSSPPSKKQKQSSTPSSSENHDTITNTTTSPSTPNNNTTTSSSSPTTKSKTNSVTASSTPSRSTSITSTTSTTESRLTMSRAILCSAASLVFQKLTPDYNEVTYDRDDDEEDHDGNFDGLTSSKELQRKKKMYVINALDIPQNKVHGDDDTTTKEQNIKQTDEMNELDPKGESNLLQTSSSKADTAKGSSSSSSKSTINMEAVTMSAEIFASRTIDQTRSAVNLSNNRRKWRMDCAKRALMDQQQFLFHGMNHDGFRSFGRGNESGNSQKTMGVLEKWLTWDTCSKRISNNHGATTTSSANCVTDGSSDENDFDQEDEDYYVSRNASIEQSEEWNIKCLPRIVNVMNTGPGHLIVHDMQWKSRFGRVAEVLKSLAFEQKSCPTATDGMNINWIDRQEPNYGPHLIITTRADFGHYMGIFDRLDHSILDECPFSLRSLGYVGDRSKRRKLRKKHFTEIGVSSLKDAPFNVIVTTYSIFIQDYLHFCNFPFQAVVLDDGMSWLGTASHDPNALLGKVFDKGIWNQSDNHIGLAGVNADNWDFGLELSSKEIIERRMKEDKRTMIGMTARHRIIIASTMHTMYRGILHPSPVPGLMSFLFPQFMDVVREEWDRSRLQNCSESIEHMRQLLCRGIVVYTGTNAMLDMHTLALQSMLGKLSIQMDEDGSSAEANISDSDSTDNNQTHVSTDAMIKENKIVQSRRFAASWLRHDSPIRFELGTTSLEPITGAIKAKASSGFVCEEIVTASSLTSNGAGGAICGPAAFKNATRCGRSFASEQGLKQHIAAFHAPPGTWLCRSCGVDCGTSLARTHHERSCGSSAASAAPGEAKENSLGGAIPTVGQAKKKKTSGNRKDANEKDENGCTRVSGYVGVFKDPEGKYFVKIEGKPLQDESSEADKIDFDSAEEAARTHDDEVKKRSDSNQTNLKLNFKSDGSRIIYDNDVKNTTKSAGRNLDVLGGGASSVVPALSVINIKDLPKGVVPLLRDPKQTPRTGANAKRHVYAYRGVCRQARKGHDRWQSQISFCGTNHYLGTFDSEWDAAAIYAWAHLILYGEEATQKAKIEGEEAVAAYEQEQKDIAEGKIPPPSETKPKKKKPTKTKSAPRGRKKKDKTKAETSSLPKLAPLDEVKPLFPQMALALTGTKSMEMNDHELIKDVSSRLLACRQKESHNCSCCCIPVSKSTKEFPFGCALLVGLNAVDSNWDFISFLQSTQHLLTGNESTLQFALDSEFGDDGINTRFRTIVKGFPCVIGRASKHLEDAASSLGFYGTGLGGTIGDVDCNIGGIDDSCSDIAAILSFSQEEESYQFTACSTNDSVSVNGNKIDSSKGRVNIENNAILSVGSRVFVFICLQ